MNNLLYKLKEDFTTILVDWFYSRTQFLRPEPVRVSNQFSNPENAKL